MMRHMPKSLVMDFRRQILIDDSVRAINTSDVGTLETRSPVEPRKCCFA